MESPPASMFFPVGVVVQYANGTVLTVLDPECRHDIQCALACESALAGHQSETDPQGGVGQKALSASTTSRMSGALASAPSMGVW